ncbi:MAG: hypothetical protein WAU01_12465, partial [Saprospiraceae bacterium]
EFAGGHQVNGGFFETTYIPWLAQISKRNQSEVLGYYMLESFKEEIGKKLQSKDKLVEEFTKSFIMGDFWSYFGRRKMDMFGTLTDVIVFIEDGSPSFISPMINGLSQGRSKLVNNHGQVTGNLYFKDDKLEGNQKYYHTNGKIIESTDYVGGKKNGVRTLYYPNGNIMESYTYLEDQIEGHYTTYYPNGGINCKGQFVHGQEDGDIKCFYPNGSVRVDANLVNGALQGPHKLYNEVGDLTYDFNYTNGEMDGECKEYFDGHILKSKGIYRAGKPVDAITYYFENQMKSQESLYKNGKLDRINQYYIIGNLSQQQIFDSKEAVERIIYFDYDGKKYYEETYADGKQKAGWQYTTHSEKPTELKLGSDYQVKDLSGQTLSQGGYIKGMMNGTWKYYHPNGKLSASQTLNNNLIDGIRTEYNEAGKISARYTYKSDIMEGKSELYSNGVLSDVSYFLKGSKTGPYLHLNKNAKISYEGFLKDQISNHKLYSYYQDGSISGITDNINDFVTESTNYMPNGKMDLHMNYSELNGEITTVSSDGLVISIAEYTHGIKDGKFVLKEKDGSTIVETRFKNGVVHGPYTLFSYTGHPIVESDYYCGKPHGQSKYYDLAGKLRLTYGFMYGTENGKVHRYYQNQQMMYQSDMVNGKQHGLMTYYDIGGQPIASVVYTMGYITSYSILNKDGKLGDQLPVKWSGKMEIRSTYPDGSPAFNLSLQDGKEDGKLEIYTQKGQLSYSSNFTENVVDGERIEYYPNGQVYKIEQFEHGNYQGLQEYYDVSGKIMISAAYVDDNLHGDLKLYKNGILTKTKTFDTEVLIGIK